VVGYEEEKNVLVLAVLPLQLTKERTEKQKIHASKKVTLQKVFLFNTCIHDVHKAVTTEPL